MPKDRKTPTKTGQAKGGILRAHLDWARQNLGADFTERLRAGLTDASQELLSRKVLVSEWIPFQALIEIDQAIAGLLGGDPAECYRALGRYSAQQNLTTLYKAFTRQDPHAFFKKEALLHGQFLDFGTAVYVHEGPTRCRLELRDYPHPSRVFCLSAQGYYQHAARIQGGPNAQADEIKCSCRGDDACVFQIRWDTTSTD
jgi:uncharacterized protein (TIGR02265 family)